MAGAFLHHIVKNDWRSGRFTFLKRNLGHAALMNTRWPGGHSQQSPYPLFVARIRACQALLTGLTRVLWARVLCDHGGQGHLQGSAYTQVPFDGTIDKLVERVRLPAVARRVGGISEWQTRSRRIIGFRI
jgi:hypothetical protein